MERPEERQADDMIQMEMSDKDVDPQAPLRLARRQPASQLDDPRPRVDNENLVIRNHQA